MAIVLQTNLSRIDSFRHKELRPVWKEKWFKTKYDMVACLKYKGMWIIEFGIESQTENALEHLWKVHGEEKVRK